MQDEAPGMVFWHPRGFALYRVLEEAARRQLSRERYVEVRTPQALRRGIWAKSGHWDAFGARGMFALERGSEGEEGADHAALKPVSCPGHIEIFARSAPSWRALPARIAEFGLVHRDEPSGSLHGLLRLRQFTQDDGHIFCEEAQVAEEVARFVGSVRRFYEAFGFERVFLARSLRPAHRLGEEASWDDAERWLGEAADVAQMPYEDQPGEGAFYGPKLELALEDKRGKRWQCGTIQIDLVMPHRFELGYVDRSGAKRAPVMLHRALYGSLERFMALLLEHHHPNLPLWLCPEQVCILPVDPREHSERAWRVHQELAALGLRVHLDERDESLGRRLAEASQRCIPIKLIIGDREVCQGSVSLRQGGSSRELPLWAALDHLQAACTPPL
jgi:threonyl-tRNA synthetase